MNTHGLARQLIWLWQRYIETTGGTRVTPTAKAARAKFDGATEAAHAVGYGLTAAHVSSIVRENIFAVAGNDVNRWLSPEVINEVSDRLNKVVYVGNEHVEANTL